MSKEFASPLSLELKPSKLLKIFLVIVHLLAIVSVLIAGVPLAAKLLFIALITISFFYYQTKNNIHIRLVWMSGNKWFVYKDKNPVIEAHLIPMSFLINWLVVLALKTEEGQRINVVIPYDALDNDSFRRLKVKLVMLKPAFFQADRDQEF